MVSIAFGPVPSRRLGMSLGINNIPPKFCSYSCVYCQIGNTDTITTERSRFYDTSSIVMEVERRIEKAISSGSRIDYLTFVPDGEPTLDHLLGDEIRLLKDKGPKIAVITNSSLLWDTEVRKDLVQADWISIKVDTVDSNIWRRINRPSPHLKLEGIINGIKDFVAEFNGYLATETMLVSGMNDGDKTLEETSDFLKSLEPDTAYISIPTRPPAVGWLKPPTEEIVNQAYQIFSKKLQRVELLTGYEGNLFAYTGNVTDDILRVVSVHPMREEAINEMLSKANCGWETIEEMIARKQLKEVEYQGVRFFMRPHSL
ncbi:MAG: radical SAM protein [Thermoplasmatales archaeon]|nr:radical SAM protein [Candidatus Thermoplasmatota archaeon]MDA8055690.1 radical SAM protein [Thermoplasmatales archaeon]